MILGHRLFNSLEHHLLLEDCDYSFVVHFIDGSLELVVKADLLYQLNGVVKEPIKDTSKILLVELLPLCLKHVSLHSQPSKS